MTDRVFSVVLALPEEILGAVITETTERGGTVLRVSVLSEGPEELAVASAPEPDQDPEQEPELVRARRRLSVDHRAPPIGRRRGVVRPTSETPCGLVLLRRLTTGPQTGSDLSAALVERGYSAGSSSPTISRLTREGVVHTTNGGLTYQLTSGGEDLVLSEEHEQCLRRLGLEVGL